MSNKTEKERNKTRQNFLLTFFEDKSSKNETKEVNGFFLVKHLNSNTGLPEIAIYNKEAYKKVIEYQALLAQR